MPTQSEPSTRPDPAVSNPSETSDDLRFRTIRWEMFNGAIHLSNVRIQSKPS
jgi:hypothetical protein